MTRGFVVGLLGAPGTGKSSLASELARALSDAGERAVLLPDPLRESCEGHRRSPRADELPRLAHEQSLRMAAAAALHDIVVADTTALMIAVHNEQVHGDRGLYSSALGAQAACDLTLLTALDLPFEDAEARMRESVDALLRAALRRASVAYSVVTGRGPQRLDNALRAVRRTRGIGMAQADAESDRPWHWVCERCSDAACERHLLPSFEGR